ncbi:MAG: GNAT family N-acetyltransferase [Candidatus Anstonellaceae archaeon]
MAEETLHPPFPPSLSVRKAKSSDMAAVHEMAALLFPNSQMRSLPGDVYLVAEKNGILVGFCHYRIHWKEKKAYIAGLGVLAHYREHGVGSQLMAEALYRIDKKGVQTTILKVRALNHAAKLYLNFGFFERRWGDTLVLVRKKPS